MLKWLKKGPSTSRPVAVLNLNPLFHSMNPEIFIFTEFIKIQLLQTFCEHTERKDNGNNLSGEGNYKHMMRIMKMITSLAALDFMFI